jgi:hypothetical protein
MRDDNTRSTKNATTVKKSAKHEPRGAIHRLMPVAVWAESARKNATSVAAVATCQKIDCYIKKRGERIRLNPPMG